ncbi:glycosyltransferase [Cereibacter sphaeroides]|uniref:glycosyltransferase n=1 Tax=Cereibacter sphaeroides TaxID=1063 RepID=UPI001F20EE22|nr:glycosyltransferase [Cereibacter sphaeroides]MCE6959057.1 glycosyltransferase [Cereibacter sphaeroides]MCE6973601.1 glycosyltransferase [Cereibacter sphaeroides]
MTRPKVGCLIPAFNEAARIGGVLRAVIGHPLIDEVLVVDDGSSDATVRVAEGHGARVIAMPRNGGKTAAVAAGVAALRCDLLLMLDADLTGLDAAALDRLLGPVLHGKADVAISLRGNAPLAWRLIGLDYISGERVLPRAQLAGRVGDLCALPRFGLEVFLNRIWMAEGARVAIIDWPGVASPAKAHKRGLVAGARADAAMLADIFRTISPAEALRQIATLRNRRLRDRARRDPAVPAAGVAALSRWRGRW